MKPLVSVIVPTYNRPQPLLHALFSIADQRNVPGAVEAIVVNDGGADVTLSVNAARDHDLRVQLIDLATNRGLPAARNAGIEASHGELLAFLDDDDVYLPDHLAAMVGPLGSPRIEAAYGDCAVSHRRVDPALPFTAQPGLPFPFDADLLSVANFMPVHTAVLRRPPDDARFDPNLRALEDWDMWLRLTREHRYRFIHVPKTTVVYHQILSQDSMCNSTARDGSALAEFGKLTYQMWRRWPAKTPAVQRFRLYIAVMYWHALTSLADGQPLANNYFLQCVGHLAAAWHGVCAEDGLTQRIVDSIKDGSDGGLAS